MVFRVRRFIEKLGVNRLPVKPVAREPTTKQNLCGKVGYFCWKFISFIQSSHSPVKINSKQFKTYTYSYENTKKNYISLFTSVIYLNIFVQQCMHDDIAKVCCSTCQQCSERFYSVFDWHVSAISKLICLFSYKDQFLFVKRNEAELSLTGDCVPDTSKKVDLSISAIVSGNLPVEKLPSSVPFN